MGEHQRGRSVDFADAQDLPTSLFVIVLINAEVVCPLRRPESAISILSVVYKCIKMGGSFSNMISARKEGLGLIMLLE